MSVIVSILLSVLAVSLISLIGLITLSFKDEWLKKWIFLAVGVSTGALLGDSFFHLIPKSIEAQGLTGSISFSLLSGIIIFFIFEKYLNWHNCKHNEKCDCDIHNDERPENFGYMNLYAESIHNFIDGIIIAGSYLINPAVGIATTIAVVLHEIPQEIGDFGVLIHAGFSKSKALLYNFLSALTAFIGAIATLLLQNQINGLESYLVAFAAGSFIYVAGSDLIPELHKEVRGFKSILQIISVLAGILLMYGLLFLE